MSTDMSSKQCCHDPLDGRSTLRYEVDTRAHYVGIICTACGHGLHTPVEWPTDCPHCQEVYEIWANSEGFMPVTTPENYQRRVIEQMREAAVRGLSEKTTTGGTLAPLSGVGFLQTWMRTPNPMLGGAVPLAMMKSGKGQRLAQFMEAALEAEQAPEKS